MVMYSILFISGLNLLARFIILSNENFNDICLLLFCSFFICFLSKNGVHQELSKLSIIVRLIKKNDKEGSMNDKIFIANGCRYLI